MQVFQILSCLLALGNRGEDVLDFEGLGVVDGSLHFRLSGWLLMLGCKKLVEAFSSEVN